MGICYCTDHRFTANTAGCSILPVVSTEPVKPLFLELVLVGKEGQEIHLLASLLLYFLSAKVHSRSSLCWISVRPQRQLEPPMSSPITVRGRWTPQLHHLSLHFNTSVSSHPSKIGIPNKLCTHFKVIFSVMLSILMTSSNTAL